MKPWSTWTLSAKLAWQHPLVRWLWLCVALMFVGTVPFFVYRLLPHAYRSGTVVLHYNVYFGIDRIQTWGWMFFLPFLWLCLLVFDACLSFGFFCRDRSLSIGLTFVAFLWSIGWMAGLISLFFMN